MTAKLAHARIGKRSSVKAFDLSEQIVFRLERRDRSSGNNGQPREVDSRYLLLNGEHDNRLEGYAVKQKMRQHDCRQPRLVSTRNAI